jgi:hypothetical protein
MKQLFTTLAAFFLLNIVSYGQADTINAGNRHLQISKLKEGTNHYLVYYTDSLFNLKGSGDIWERSTTFITKNSTPLIEFNWKWFHHDSLLAQVLNICDAETLAPVFHKAVYRSKGIIAYDFRNSFMIPSDSIENNAVIKKPKLELQIPVISWEQDLETYPLLPVKKVGQIFEIAFFDPNEKAPAYHRYEVIGKENLQLNNDSKITCWLLKIDYSKSSYAVFWLTEKSKEVIKMKEFFNGNYRFKVKLY